MIKPSFEMQMTFLPQKVFHIQCLNDEKKQIKGVTASGFIVQEGADLFLYTCWHVVTGFNMNDVRTTNGLPERKFLHISLQLSEKPNPDTEVISGSQSIVLSLYDEKGNPKWIQEEKDTPNYSLNCINLKVPFMHDVVKLLLPKDISISKWQIITRDYIYPQKPRLGEKVLVVGYPYGYSSLGLEQPTPITLTRFIASDNVKDRAIENLLDGACSPGMSGGPVFLERDGDLLLAGMCTGLIFPDHIIQQYERTTALGTITPLVVWWSTTSKIYS